MLHIERTLNNVRNAFNCEALRCLRYLTQKNNGHVQYERFRKEANFYEAIRQDLISISPSLRFLKLGNRGEKEFDDRQFSNVRLSSISGVDNSVEMLVSARRKEVM